MPRLLFKGKDENKKPRWSSCNQSPPMLPVRRVRSFQSCASAGSILYALAQTYGGTRHFHADQPPEAYCGNERLTSRNQLEANVWRCQDVRIEPPASPFFYLATARHVLSHWNFTRMFKQVFFSSIVFRQSIWFNCSVARRHRSQQFVRMRDLIINSRKCFSSFFFQVTYSFGRGKIKPTKHSTQEHR